MEGDEEETGLIPGVRDKRPVSEEKHEMWRKNYNLFEFKQLLGFLFLRTCLEVLGDKLSTDGGTDRRTD